MLRNSSGRHPKLGQHFLASARILERIAVAACPDGTEQVIEIGPGQGALTERLLERSKRVVAIEMDSALADRLRERWMHEPRLELVEGNALNFDWKQWGPGVLAGNLPYYVATAIISKYLADPGPLKQAVFLIQKEVAERITATPGHREFGYLSVECQHQAKVEYLLSVPPGAFRPPPKVDSAVIRLTPHPAAQSAETGGPSSPCNAPTTLTPHSAAQSAETKAFLEFASRCFRQKRKTLRNNLTEFYAKEKLAGLPALSRRAEQLSVAELLELFRTLTRTSEPAPQE